MEDGGEYEIVMATPPDKLPLPLYLKCDKVHNIMDLAWSYSFPSQNFADMVELSHKLSLLFEKRVLTCFYLPVVSSYDVPGANEILRIAT